jgi:hypothetical protein
MERIFPGAPFADEYQPSISIRNPAMKCLLAIPLAMVAACCLFVSGCQFTTAHFSDVTMAKQVGPNLEPLERTTTFFKHDTLLHCTAKMANTPSDTKVKAVWFFTSDEKTRKPIDSVEITADKDVWVDFTLNPSYRDYAYGSYVVDLSINGKLKQSMPFTMKPMFEKGPIFDAVMAAGVNDRYFPVSQMAVFPVDIEVIYASVYADQLTPGSVVAAEWYAKSAAGERKGLVKSEIPIEQAGWIAFSLKPAKTLPPDKYYVDILHNGNVATTMEFTIK